MTGKKKISGTKKNISEVPAGFNSCSGYRAHAPALVFVRDVVIPREGFRILGVEKVGVARYTEKGGRGGGGEI